MTDDGNCPVCRGERPVVWMLTHLNPAGTIYSCEEDLESALLALLAERLGVEVGFLAGKIDEAVDLFEAIRTVEDTPYEQPADEMAVDADTAAVADAIEAVGAPAAAVRARRPSRPKGRQTDDE